MNNTHNQIVINLSCSNLEAKNIIDNINLSLSGEIKGKKENLLFIELKDDKTIKLNDLFIYTILRIGTEAVANAIISSIIDRKVILKFIDTSSNIELYVLNSNELHKESLIDKLTNTNLSKKEIAQNFIQELREKNLKQQLSEMFTKKLWVRNFTRNKLKELDEKIDSLHQAKEFSLKDVKKISSFLYPVSEALKYNKKPIIKEYIRRLQLVEFSINKEISPSLLETMVDANKSKKNYNITNRISRMALNGVGKSVVGAVLGSTGLASLAGFADFSIDIEDDDTEIG